MSYADKLFKQACRDIIEHGTDTSDEKIRPHWEDGEPAYTIKKFGVVNEYDLRKEFPALTLRRVALKSAMDEILWIYQKKSTNVEDLSTHIWDSWATPVTDNTRLVLVEKPDITHLINEEKCLSLQEIYKQSFEFSDIIRNYFGEHLNRWVKIWKKMIGKCTNEKSTMYGCISRNFLSCEYFLLWVMKTCNDKSKLGELKLDKKYYGHNYYSEITCTLLTPEQKSYLKNEFWYLYDKKYYFSKIDIANQIAKDKNLECICPNKYGYIEVNPELDRVFAAYKKLGIITAIEVNGEHVNVSNNTVSLNRFSLEPVHSICTAYGYSIGEKFEFNGEMVDQMDYVLKQLKETPFSRRIMTNMYQYKNLATGNLDPCAYSMTYNVTKEDGKLVLNGILNQRSQDMLASNGWNTAQYAILLMMIAQVNDMIPGKFIHVIADAHIYDRHIPMVKELIEREEYPAPKVRLNPNVKNFYDFTTDDLIVEDYQFGEQITDIPIAI